jgi:2-keto-4-pentenoate hydratase/2-oxohepta-3-ene-1,7-dioic acid hydratase in catechol pathway
MKIIRYKNNNLNSDSYGIIESNTIYPIIGTPYTQELNINRDYAIPLDLNLLLVPCKPTKVVALAINYQGATGQTVKMSEPLVFLKSTNAIVPCNHKVKLPFTSNTWGEAELGVVMKNTTSPKVSASNVKEYILGYTYANDISSDNVEDRDHHLARSKSADGFCPVGQFIDTDYAYQNKEILAYHNDILLREGNTDQMIWNPERIIVWLSTWMTLYSGDIIITGTPSRVRDRLFLKDGDTYTVKIEGFPDMVTSFYG